MNSNKHNIKKNVTHWHPAFCSAMELELRENKDDLVFHREESLSKEPLSLDLLVLTRIPETLIHNPLGAIFKEHNIIEYKAPGDKLNIDVFAKGIAYACLYKSLAPKVNGIPFEALTLTFIRQGVPKKLLKQLKNYGFKVENPTPGIYYIHTEIFQEPHIQIIATSQLTENDHLWLTSLTRSLTTEHAISLVEAIDQLTAKDDRELADSILHVAISENKRIFQKIMEVPDMCDALRELFQPEIDQLDAKYQAQMADKDARIAEMNTRHKTQLTEMNTRHQAELADKNEIIRQLQAKLAAAGINQ